MENEIESLEKRLKKMEDLCKEQNANFIKELSEKEAELINLKHGNALIK